MQNGSLVKMITDIVDKDKNFLAKYNITRFPTTGNDIYTVSEFFPKPPNWKAGPAIKDCVSLEEFPEIAAQRLFFDAELFREIQAPDEVNIQEIVEESIYVMMPNTLK